MYERRQPLTIRNLIVGTILGIIGTPIIYAVISYVVITGSYVKVILFLPDLIGLVRHVTPENTLNFSGPGTYTIRNFEKGQYLIYVNNSPYRPRVSLTSLETGEVITAHDFRIAGQRSEIPLIPNDNYQLARGFEIPVSGDYSITIANFPGALRITPDITKNRDTVFVLALIIQPLLIFYISRGVYRWKHRQKIAARKVFIEGRGEKFDDWLTSVKKHDE